MTREQESKTALSQQTEQQPFGWVTEDYLTDKSATTYDQVVADRWRAKGWPVREIYAAPIAQTAPQGLRIVFDGPPGPEAGRFVEVENASGCSVNAGEWRARADGLWELVLHAAQGGE